MNRYRKQSLKPGKFLRRRIFFAGLAMLLLSVTGCGMLNISKSQPKAHVNSLLLTNVQTGPVTYPVLQQQLMRFADTYAATVAQACDEISANNTNTVIRLTALRWKLGQATSAYTDATGQNPVVNALDFCWCWSAYRGLWLKVMASKLMATSSCRCWMCNAVWRRTPGSWRAACSNRRSNRSCGI